MLKLRKFAYAFTKLKIKNDSSLTDLTKNY